MRCLDLTTLSFDKERLNMKANLFFPILIRVMIVGVLSKEIEVSSKDKREYCAERVNAISSNIAIKAAQEAKAAENAQFSAARRASYRVKEQLAEKAIEAAKAAQAAAAIKTALVDELYREKEALKYVILELISNKRAIERAICEELKALHGDKSALSVLLSALRIAQTTTCHADSTLRGIQDDLVEKQRELGCALQRTNLLTRDESCARQDVLATKCAARKAVMAATQARAMAMRNKRTVQDQNHARGQ